MRLPDIKYNRPVQSLGREDPNAPIRVAAAQAQVAQYAGAGLREAGKAISAGARFLNQEENKWAEHEAQLAVVQATREVQDKQAQIASQKEIKTNELPDSVREASGISEYVNNSDGGVEEIESDVVPTYEVSVGLYDFNTKAIGSRYAANLKSGKAKKIFERAWATHTTRGRGTVVNGSIKVAREVEAAKTVTAAQNLADQGFYDDARQIILSAGNLIAPLKKQEIINQFKYSAATAPLEKAMAQGDLTVMDSQIEALKDPEYKGFLSQKNRLAYIRTLENRRDEVKAEQILKTRTVNAKFITNEAKMVAAGTSTQARLDSLLDKEFLTIDQYRSWSVKLQGVKSRLVETTNNFAGISQSLAAGVPVDASLPGAKKQINEYWKKVQGGSFEGAAQMATRSNIMPSGATNQMLMWSNSGDPKMAIPAAEFYNTMIESGKGHLFPGIKGAQSQILRNTATNLRVGFEPKIAYERAVESANVTPEMRSTLGLEYPKYGAENGDALADLIGSSEMNAWFSISPNPTLAMRSEFDVLVRENYVRNSGNIDNARSAAFYEMQSRWSATDVSPNGKDYVLRDTPENVLNLSGAMITSDVLAFVTPYVDKIEGVDADEVFIIEDNGTKVDPVRNGWPMMYVDPNTGGYAFVRDERGAPIRYNPSRRDVRERVSQVSADRVNLEKATAQRSGKSYTAPITDALERAREGAMGRGTGVPQQ